MAENHRSVFSDLMQVSAPQVFMRFLRVWAGNRHFANWLKMELRQVPRDAGLRSICRFLRMVSISSGKDYEKTYIHVCTCLSGCV